MIDINKNFIKIILQIFRFIWISIIDYIRNIWFWLVLFSLKLSLLIKLNNDDEGELNWKKWEKRIKFSFCLRSWVGGLSQFTFTLYHILIIFCLFFLLVWIPTDRWEYFIRKYCKVLLHWEYTTTYYCQHFQILSIQKDKNFKSSEACDLYEKWRSVEILQMEHHRWLYIFPCTGHWGRTVESLQWVRLSSEVWLSLQL